MRMTCTARWAGWPPGRTASRTRWRPGTCPLGAIGHPKDGVRGRLQIVYGLLTSKDGVPVAIEVFKGSTGDPKTAASQVAKIKDRFALTRVALAGDRGMLTAARLREDMRPTGLDWITALRAPQVKALVHDGALQLELFDEMDLAEISSPDYPGERLVACKNPFLQAERAASVRAFSRPPRLTWPKSPPQSRQALHHQRQCRRPGQQRGRLPCKALAHVERAFWAFNTDLDIRPIRHRTKTRVRAHVFLRMLSYYITRHMQARLAPILFTDDDKAAAQATRPSPVAPAARSARALAKAAAKHTEGNLPVHSFDSLLTDLATICLNQIQPADSTSSASATASGPRSHQPAHHHPETPGKRPHARIIVGNFGLAKKSR